MSRPRRTPKQKLNYSALSLKEAMKLIPAEQFIHWHLPASPRPPSDFFIEDLRRLEAFDLKSSEQAKTLLIDALLAETVPLHPKLKIWKAATITTDMLTGVADYVMAPRRAYLETPLLCVAEAKKDDFEQGAAQCVAEMVACQQSNREESHEIDVYGIVSNGQGWQFYKLTLRGEVYETAQYGLEDLDGILGALDYMCSECARNVPIQTRGNS